MSTNIISSLIHFIDSQGIESSSPPRKNPNPFELPGTIIEVIVPVFKSAVTS